MKKIAYFLGFVVLFSLSLRWYGHTDSQNETYRFWLLDVGQGQSALVLTPEGKTLLYDGGPSDRVLHELGQVLPPWRRSIDLIVLSHPHSDHIRGLIEVIKRMDVHEIWSSGARHTTADYRAWLEQIEQKHIPHTIVFQGQEKQWENLQLRVVHPPRDMGGSHPANAHDATVSLRLLFYSLLSLFLTGDLNDNHEYNLLRDCQPPSCLLASQILQIPHHGSASGLEPDFLAAVNPHVAIIPVGKDNRFNHPRAEIIERLETANIPIFRTDTDGRLAIEITQSGARLETTRNDRTWQIKPTSGRSAPPSAQSLPRQPRHPAWEAQTASARASPFFASVACPLCRSQ